MFLSNPNRVPFDDKVLLLLLCVILYTPVYYGYYWFKWTYGLWDVPVFSIAVVILIVGRCYFWMWKGEAFA